MSQELRVPSVEVSQLEIAMDWLLRLQEGSAGERDIAEWLIWYEEAEGHRRAFAEAEQLWRQSGRVVDGPQGVSVAQLLGRSTGLNRVHRRRRWLQRAAMVAGVAVMLALGMRLINERSGGLRAASPVPVREKVLPDGSRVQLAAKSFVDVRYTEKQRVLELKGGEAYFAVEPNVARPFIVKVGSMYVRAVGTAFDIRRARDRVVVTVAKGVVDIYPEDPNSGTVDEMQGTSKSHPTAVLRAAAGRQVTWSGSSIDPSTTSIDPELVLGWRAGRLQYIHEPLDAVIADINRYSDHPVIIRDRAAGEIAFTGTVFVNALDVWLAALPGEFPIDVLTDTKGNTVLASRATDHP